MASHRVHVLLSVQHLDGFTIAALPTEIDIANAAAVSDTLLALFDQGASGLVVDMTGTRFCDVAGVRAIVRAHCHARSVGGWVRVVVTDHRVRRMFAVTGAEDIVMLYPGLEPPPCRAVRGGRRLRTWDLALGAGTGPAQIGRKKTAWARMAPATRGSGVVAGQAECSRHSARSACATCTRKHESDR